MTVHDIDPIDLEVLRSRLETIGDQACRAVEHTAVCPSITESKDYSVTILDASGGLIIGSGEVVYHYGAARHAVKSTIARHGETIREGDVFLSNDPHNGGGLHPQDVMVQQPIFHDGALVAWVAVSAHLMDMGGMVLGSFSPEATECYQESFRVPPVRLFRQGVEMTDMWDLLRNNVRMAELVEMDMRGLVAGAHFATARVGELVELTGPEKFATSLTAIRDLTEAEMRRRIARIADGSYKATSWTEFLTEFYKVPCKLTVEGDTLTFDFEGASPQCKRYFNSKPYIIAAELVVMIYRLIAPDLPFNDGMFEPIKLICPEGSIVNCTPPAPIAAAHMHVGLNAAGVGLEALMLALSASPDSEFHGRTGGASWDSAIGVQLWTWTDQQGRPDAYLTFEGLWAGSSAGAARDGNDHGRNVMGPPVEASYPDIEVLESWFPLLFTERAIRRGAEGAGAYRAGGGNHFAFRPHGIDTLHGVTFGTRRWLPLQGFAGGRPGACNEFVIHRADGTDKMIDVSTSGEMIHEGDWYEVRLAGGGGFGDPLDRDPAMVERDVRRERLTSEEARSAYGVILGDPAATHRLRNEMRQARLAIATPAPKPLSRSDVKIAGEPMPLYTGIVHHGPVAVAEISGAPLAIAPDPWTAGCPMIEEQRWDESGPAVVYRTWLDPETGRSLHVEVALAGETDGFHVAPKHWVEAA